MAAPAPITERKRVKQPTISNHLKILRAEQFHQWPLQQRPAPPRPAQPSSSTLELHGLVAVAPAASQDAMREDP